MMSLAAKHHWTLDKVQDMPEMEYWCWIAYHVKEEESYQQNNKPEVL